MRQFGRMMISVLVALALLYAADWGVFQLRLAQGAGMESVPVEQYLKTALKGNKVEYDYLGLSDENCSRTVFPQYAASTLNPPCWWLKRHNQRWQ